MHPSLMESLGLAARMALGMDPFSLVHFVTERCNARCRHCFIDFHAPSDQSLELSLHEIRRLTGKLGSPLYNVNLTGGEPFMRSDLPEIVEAYIANSSVRSIVITTNGWFTDRINNLLERYQVLDTDCTLTICVSIDEIDEKHDEQRGLIGLYERALASYHAVVRTHDPRIRADISLTVTGANADRTSDILRTLRQRDIDSVFPILLREEGAAHLTGDKTRIANGYRKLAAAVSLLPRDDSRNSIQQALHRSKNRIARDIIHDTCLNPRFLTRCRAGSQFASIGADGSVAPCELLAKKHPIGNLRDHDMDFQFLWRDQPAQEARKTIVATQCHCTFECAWTVNIISTPRFWPRLFYHTMKELL